MPPQEKLGQLDEEPIHCDPNQFTPRHPNPPREDVESGREVCVESQGHHVRKRWSGAVIALARVHDRRQPARRPRSRPITTRTTSLRRHTHYGQPRRRRLASDRRARRALRERNAGLLVRAGRTWWRHSNRRWTRSVGCTGSRQDQDSTIPPLSRHPTSDSRSYEVTTVTDESWNQCHGSSRNQPTCDDSSSASTNISTSTESAMTTRFAQHQTEARSPAIPWAAPGPTLAMTSSSCGPGVQGLDDRVAILNARRRDPEVAQVHG